MSLLRDIQDAAVTSDTDISVLLRMCRILAARLGNEQFKSWVESELEGYQSADELPDYRILKVFSKGNFVGSFGRSLSNAAIPISCLPKEAWEKFSHSYLIQPISFYESLVKGSKKRSGSLEEPWSPDFVVNVGQQIYEDMNCLSAWKVIPWGSIVSLIDAVRNKVLSFVLEIEAENPDAGEAPINSNPVPQEKVAQIFNTYISGNVQNVATGSSNISQIGIIELKHNKEALAELLRIKGIPSADIKDLLKAIEDDRKVEPDQKNMGPKVTNWLGSMLKKSARGAWKVSSGVATAVLTKAITAYYGLE